MKRKLTSVILAAATITSLLAGCGAQKETTAPSADSTKAEAPAAETQAETQAAEAPAADAAATTDAAAADEGKVLNIRAWNEEFKSRVIAHYPGYEEVDGTTGMIGDVTVNWIIVPNDDNAYQNALDEALINQESASADEKVDMFLIEADYALKYSNTDYTMDIVNDLGITQDQLAGQYQYTQDVVKDSDGNIKASSWQACPGVMIYRRDIATEVFGTDDPVAIQEKFSDWDKFMEASAELKEAGYLATASANDTNRVFTNNVSSKWVEDGKIVVDDSINKWVEMSKEMVEKGYTTTYGMWSDDWSKGFTTAGNVFCYFGPAWFIDFTLGGHDLDGQWAACVGPQSFFWGGSWVCAATGTDNASLVKDIIVKMTCDKDTLIDIVKQDNDFANNVEAMEELAKDDTFTNKVLGGQNPLPMFCEGVKTIDLSYTSPYDQGCVSELQSAMTDYFDENCTLEEAWDTFYKNVEVTYPELTH